jgi:hypothetical protein
MNSREPANFGVPLFGPYLYLDAAAFKLGNHRIQVLNPEVKHPLLLGPAEVVSIVFEGTKDGWPAALHPNSLSDIDPKVPGVPAG